jgi:hypothetical protein
MYISEYFISISVFVPAGSSRSRSAPIDRY